MVFLGPLLCIFCGRAGGTNIFIKGIKGYGLNPNPESNTHYLAVMSCFAGSWASEAGHNHTIVDSMLTSPHLVSPRMMPLGPTPKLAWLSSLKYRLPAVNDLLMVPRRFLDSYLTTNHITMTFDLSVSETDGLNEV